MVTEQNSKLANMFYELAAFSADDPQPFKAIAYRRAAQYIAEYPTDITAVGTVKDLKKLPGIGEAIASKIVEYAETGTIKALETARAEHGPIAVALLAVEGLGPKRVKQLQEHLHITSIDDLIAAAKEHKIQMLDGFDETLEVQILQNALRVTERNTRLVRAAIQPIIESFMQFIRALPHVRQAEVAGSYRRERETVGDIDILVVSSDREKTMEQILAHEDITAIIAQGDTKISFDLQGKIRTDIRFVEPEQWGSALLYFTGSREHNIMMRKQAIAKGYKLNEYGLYDSNGTVVAQETEQAVYDALGLPYTDPKDRIL